MVVEAKADVVMRTALMIAIIVLSFMVLFLLSTNIYNLKSLRKIRALPPVSQNARFNPQLMAGCEESDISDIEKSVSDRKVFLADEIKIYRMGVRY